MKFKLLAGGHTDQKWIPATKGEIEGEVSGMVKNPDGSWKRLVKMTYNPGAVFESSRDLAKLLGKDKFERMPDDAKLIDGPSLVERLLTLPLAELRELALNHDVDLRKLTDKSEMVTTLSKALT